MSDLQINRIRNMESLLRDAREALDDLEEALTRYEDTKGKIRRLEAYYTSPLWMQDFEADEHGELPEDLERGVLSEDAVYDLLSDEADLMESLLSVPDGAGGYVAELPPMLEDFFRAENERDWETYRSYLDPDVKWYLFGRDVETVEGIDEYVEVMKEVYYDTNITFECIQVRISSDGSRVMTLLMNEEGGLSLDIFDLQRDKIIREYEFIME